MLIDFEYAGKLLSDFGCIVCTITSNNGVSTTDIGNQITFNTIPTNHTTKFKLVSSEYSDAYTAPPFQICKSPCNADDQHDMYFSEMEVRDIMRWLNRKRFFKFKPIYDDGEYAMIYFNGSFNVQTITYGSNVIGMELTLQTDAPFAHYEPIEYNITLSSQNGTFVINDISDEVGYIYPDIVEIQCLSDGKLTVSNSKDSNNVVVNNCVSGEKITLIGESKIIESSVYHQKLFNDFNYNFPKIHNDYNDGENIFSVSIPCKIHMSYSPICKVGVV